MIVGRFAPSPTGALHRGSLVAAVASYCDAHRQSGTWFVRIDDIDPPREKTGASQHILRTLKAFGFDFDRVDYQSHRGLVYKQALADLNNQELLYACYCTRKEMAGSPMCTSGCSEKTTTPLRPDSLHVEFKDVASLRFRANSLPDWHDAIQVNAADNACYDPVIWRKDGLVSYALACAMDDSADVTMVVRGSDLMDTTALQIRLMQTLDRPVPHYAHVPVLVNAKQQKLSKQTAATPIEATLALPTLQQTWACLGQTPIKARTLDEFWGAAMDQWTLSSIPKQRIIGHG